MLRVVGVQQTMTPLLSPLLPTRLSELLESAVLALILALVLVPILTLVLVSVPLPGMPTKTLTLMITWPCTQKQAMQTTVPITTTTLTLPQV
jgi:hypothetical protein